MGNKNNNVETKRLSDNLVDDDLDLIAIKIIRKFRVAIGVIVSIVIALLSFFGINIIDIGKKATIYKSEIEVLRQEAATIRQDVEFLRKFITKSEQLSEKMDNATKEANKQVEESKEKLSKLGEIKKEFDETKKDLDKTLNDLVSYQYLNPSSTSKNRIYCNINILRFLHFIFRHYIFEF